MYECKECGYHSQNVGEEKNCPMCGNELEFVEIEGATDGNVNAGNVNAESAEPVLPEKKKSAGFTGIVFTIILIFVARVAGGFISEWVINSGSERSQMKEMDAFIKKLEAYTPGEMTASGYESEYWDCRWVIDGNWEKMEESEMKKSVENAMAVSEEKALSVIRAEDVSDKFIEKFKKTLYIEQEAGYYYYDENGVCTAVAKMVVMSAYGDSESGTDSEMITELIDKTKAELMYVTQEDVVLGNQNYTCVSGKILEGEKVRMYLRQKDALLAMVTLHYMDGKDEMVEKFESMITEY